MTKAKGRARMCPCGHEAAWHTGPNRSCQYGHDHVMGGCSCEAYRSGRYRDDVTPATPTKIADPLIAVIAETIAEIDTMRDVLASRRRKLNDALTAAGVDSHRSLGSLMAAPPTAPAVRVVRPAQRRDPKPVTSGLAKCERAILTVLAQHGTRTKVQIAILAGYSHTSGGFRNSLSTLRTAGFIDGAGEAIAVTAAGASALGKVEPLPRGRALLEYWMANAGGKCERMILGELAEAHPHALAKGDLANRTNYQVTSGGFRNALSRLRTLQLIKGSRELKIAETLAEAS